MHSRREHYLTQMCENLSLVQDLQFAFSLQPGLFDNLEIEYDERLEIPTAVTHARSAL